MDPKDPLAISRWHNPTDKEARITFHVSAGQRATFKIGPGETKEVPDQFGAGIHTYDRQTGKIVSSLAPMLVCVDDPRELSDGMKKAHPELAPKKGKGKKGADKGDEKPEGDEPKGE